MIEARVQLYVSYRACNKENFQHFLCALEATLPAAHNDMSAQYPCHIRKRSIAVELSNYIA